MPLFFNRLSAQRLRMPWGVVGAIGGAVVNNVMADGKGGGGGGQQQTSSAEPWAPAAPWMNFNIARGMDLQYQHQMQPFSPQQQAAYDNSYAANDYMRRLVPNLLGQMGSQQVGFDKKNPDARPEAWNWSGLLSDKAPDLGQKSVLNAKPPPGAAGQGGGTGDGGDFMQQGGVVSGMNMGGLNMGALNGDPRALLEGRSGGTLLGNGGYGTFKYGMQPQPGTQQYRDMSAYFANGGADPNNYYGKGGDYRDPSMSPYAHLMGGGQTNGGVGIGDTGANAAAAASGNGAW
ncbi:hypothetical protein DBV14_09480 [Variovorax sp. KBW07]|uniref:hypothetical protein n=1 Tax=Variovorax sp. KBW07 TaxID=2153358 RepID=UPI000F58E6C3|nr:hypothetical protein [Variovorax sp. KBW07]RQO57030.1 hypothetical protein DBV14_09480 [Variovorax sp. KBW07]